MDEPPSHHASWPEAVAFAVSLAVFRAGYHFFAFFTFGGTLYYIHSSPADTTKLDTTPVSPFSLFWDDTSLIRKFRLLKL